MTPAEAQILLSMAASIDNRKPDPDVAKAWAAGLDGLNLDDCRAAVVHHIQTSSEWLDPARIRAYVKRMRAKRIAEHPTLTPPPGSVLEQQAWLKDARRRIGDGESIDSDAGYGELKPRHLPDLRSIMPKPDDEGDAA